MKKVNLKEFTAEYVVERRDALKTEMANDVAKMARYEKLLKLDVYAEQPESRQLLLTLPDTFELVKKLRALTWGQPPVYSVHAANEKDQPKADKIENFVYGMLSRTRMRQKTDAADWYALGQGWGWLKATYDADACEGEFPIVLHAPNPQYVYAQPNAQGDGWLEVCEVCTKTRAQVEGEFDFEFEERPSDDKKLAQWLSERVEVIELWATRVVDEKAEPDADEDDGLTEMLPVMTPEQMGKDAGLAVSDERKRQRTRHKVRKVIHCVATTTGAKALLIKKPVIMADYKRVPYVGWPGVYVPKLTGVQGESVLYSSTGGDAPDWVTGTYQAEMMTISALVDATLQYAYPSFKTRGNVPTVDTSPGAINRLGSGDVIEVLMPPGGNPMLGSVVDRLKSSLAGSGIPEVMSGQVHSLSGQAISGLASAFTMELAARQLFIEQELATLIEHELCLAKAFADPDEGWRAYGTGKYGGFVQETLTQEDLEIEYQISALMSSGLPKDGNATVALLSNLKQGEMIPSDVAIDIVQRTLRVPGASPTRWQSAILRDQALREGAGKPLGDALAQRYVDEQMANLGPSTPPPMAGPMMPPAGTMPPMAMMPPDGMGQQPPPRPRLPPSNVMPVDPALVGAGGNMEGMLNMLGEGNG